MHLIAVVDNRNGMMFHNRRQSRDRMLLERILQLVDKANSVLWMTAYSAKLFKNNIHPISITGNDSSAVDAPKGDFFFAENILPDTEHIENIILFKWNRSYPGDFFFDIDMSPWVLSETEDFAGSSHEKITMEVYIHA